MYQGTNRAPQQLPRGASLHPWGPQDPLPAQPSRNMPGAYGSPDGGMGWGCQGLLGPPCRGLPGEPPMLPDPGRKAGPSHALTKSISRGKHLCTPLESPFIFIVPYPTNGTWQHTKHECEASRHCPPRVCCWLLFPV